MFQRRPARPGPSTGRASRNVEKLDVVGIRRWLARGRRWLPWGRRAAAPGGGVGRRRQWLREGGPGRDGGAADGVKARRVKRASPERCHPLVPVAIALGHRGVARGEGGGARTVQELVRALNPGEHISYNIIYHII